MSKIYFQGTFGAYSHIAALEVDPDAEITPCILFLPEITWLNSSGR